MAAYIPHPMNQFYRLIYVSGARGTGTYARGADWNNIVNGSDYDGRNCTATMGALLRDAHTSGKSKTTPNQIRNHQNDFSGGIGWDDVNVAWQDLFNDQLGTPRSVNWTDVINYLKQGRFVGIQGDYDQVPYTYQCQKGGTFDHAFALGGYRGSDARVLRYHPLCNKASWVPQSAIRPAAEKLALAQRGSRGDLFVAITRVVAPIASTNTGWKATVPASYFWIYQVTSGKISGRTRGHTGGFSANCTPPRSLWWPATRKWYPLVQLTSGSRAGKWVPAYYAEEI